MYEFFREKFGLEESKVSFLQTKKKSILSDVANAKKITEEVKSFLCEETISKVEEKGIIFGIRAGVGGNEAKQFVSDIFKLYSLFFSFMKWNVSDITQPSSGFIRCQVDGHKVYKYMRLEAGIHRVQRIPATEKSGRYHTSTISIFVIPNVYDKVEVKIVDTDIRIDTFRASGKGGQHVNVTDSAVRVVHIPSGITVSCQQERSQQANKKVAMDELKRRLFEREYTMLTEERDSKVSQQVGGGRRNEKIRTYDFRDNSLTDNRLNIKTKQLDLLMIGKEKFFAFIKNVVCAYEMSFFGFDKISC